MSYTEQDSPQRGVQRIGIMLGGLGRANLPALEYLVLSMNPTQSTFEYEFLEVDPDDDFIKYLASRSPVNRELAKRMIPDFIARYQVFLKARISGYGLKESPPKHFVLVTMARFSDNFYSTRVDGMSVLALGNWKRYMAPPSLFEFILTLIVRETVSHCSPSLGASIHLGTKGCLFDFTPALAEVRQKVLGSFVCSYCRDALRRDGYPALADDVTTVLGRQWLGKSADCSSPAGIVAKLGYDLFTTKGLQATAWEKLQTVLQEEGVKQMLTIIGAIIVAGLLIWLGLK